MIEYSAVLTQFLNGLSQGVLLVLIAAGLSLIFGLMDVLNFAHGSFYMLGAYAGLTTYTLFNSFWFAIVAAFVFVGLIGAFIEFVTLRPLYERDPVYHLLITFGFLLVFEQVVRSVWGTGGKSFESPPLLRGSIKIFSTTFPVYRIFVIVIGVILISAIYFVVQYSNVGLIIRAGTQNEETVRSLGIKLPRIFTLTFAFGTGLAAVSGVIAAPIVGLQPTMGSSIIIDAFIIVIVGGLGSFRGAVVTSFIIAEIRALGALVLPRYTIILTLIALIITISIRPQGIFGNVRDSGGGA